MEMDFVLSFILIIIGIIGIVFSILSLYFSELAKSIREGIGVPPGEIKYIDSVRVIKPKVLYSEKYKLKGKPDMIILENNQFIPIEHKPTSEKVYTAHIMQLLAYCLLAEETYRVTPSYGILVLKDSKKEKVDFTEEGREKLINVLTEMRDILDKNEMPVHLVGQKKCSSCGYEKMCEKLVREV